MKQKKNAEISVIIPTRNRPESLGRVLHALEKQAEAITEVIVVDTSSTPFAQLTKRTVSAFPSLSIRYFRRALASASLARNVGIAKSLGQVLAFLDDDAVPAAGWANAVQQAAATGPFWFRGLCVDVSTDTSVVHRVYTFYKELTTNDMYRQWSTYRTHHGYRIADFIQAGNFFVRREALSSVRPVFDARLFPFIAEGADLSLRIRQSGGQILFVPKAKIYHHFLRLSYRNFVIHEAFWYGRASSLFQWRSERSLATLGTFGSTTGKTLRQKSIARFWRLLRGGYVLYRTRYARNVLHDLLFALVFAHYLLCFGAGRIYGRLEAAWRLHAGSRGTA